MSIANTSSSAKLALAGKAWADVADLIDLQLSPLGLHAIEALAPRTGERILDVGCGAGQTVLQLAQCVGSGGKVTGVDIAPQLLEIARKRSAGLGQVELVEHDAAKLALADQSLDGVYSRFGVMAFPDTVAAFLNFRRMLKPSGRMAFVCWRALHENELDALPLQAAGLEARLDATPFSFADPDKIRATLRAAGFRQVSMEAHDEPVSCGGLQATLAVLLSVGPLGRILRENPDLRADAELRVRAAFVERASDVTIALNAATWVVAAHP